NEISYYCSQFLCTRGGDGVSLRTKTLNKEYAVHPIETVSTIGAGDNFNAGILYGLIKQDITREKLYTLSENEWEQLLRDAMAFSENVCQSLNNYIDPLFGKQMKDKLTAPV
ncbi:MAG: PfkB family carbohydrate kinase, partial [Bacteroidaceae bacterium]